MSVYGYVRYSEVDKVKGVNRQREVVTKFFTQILQPKGLTFEGFYKDAGKDARRILTDRQMGSRLNLRVRKGDVVVIASGERCFPSLRDLINVAQSWTARGVRVVVIDFGLDTSAREGKEALSHYDQFERISKKFTSTSAKEVLVSERSKLIGKFYFYGIVPFGWKKVALPDKTFDLAPCEEEREVFRRLQEIHDRVGSYVRTAAEVKRLGILSPRGTKPFTRKQIKDLIVKPHEILSDRPPKPVWAQFKKGMSEEERLRFLAELGFQRLDHHKDKPKGGKSGNRTAEADQRTDQPGGDRNPEGGPVSS